MSDLVTEDIGGFTVVRFDSDALLDRVRLGVLREALSRTIAAGGHRIILDLANVQFLFSPAISMLLGAHKQVRDTPGGRLVLCGCTDRLMEVLYVTRLERMFEVRPTVASALQ